ncbi:ABC transporter permease subunit [Shinella sp.]|uniref:ABC transporter permease n=1 Tax=Shinella sp. TaxID=1870904 RepID=UPI00289E809E|nr:ABC transporter permease subunit [Shinella sp.]
MEWLTKFPTMDAGSLRDLKKAIDEGFRGFTRAYGDSIESLFEPLQHFLIWSERFMTRTPWPIILILIALIAWFASRNWKIVVGAIATLLVIGYLDMWDDTMKTVSMIFVCTVLSIVIGIPIGILMSRSDRFQNVINPILDVMQTMPSFDAFGSSAWQKLKNVQMPLALPTIMAGINQTIMMALAMVVIASMIGVQGLGQPVLKAISNQYFTLGIFNGLAIVGIAIIFDRVSQAFGKRLQKHREIVHG